MQFHVVRGLGSRRSRRRPMNLAQNIKDQIAPILELGKEGEGAHLTPFECKTLLFVLRTSVPLEPFTELFSEIIKKTLLPQLTAVDLVELVDGKENP